MNKASIRMFELPFNICGAKEIRFTEALPQGSSFYEAQNLFISEQDRYKIYLAYNPNFNEALSYCFEHAKQKLYKKIELK